MTIVLVSAYDLLVGLAALGVVFLVLLVVVLVASIVAAYRTMQHQRKGR